MIGRWLSLVVARAMLGAAIRVLAWLAAAGVVAAAAPVSLVAAGAVGVAWLRGWQPRRLLAAAAWCGPMVAVWMALTARDSPRWQAVTAAPYRAWLGFWQLAAAGHLLRAAAVAAPLAIPIGLLAGGLAWSYRTGSLGTGAGGLSPGASAAFDERQWRHQVRAARAMIAAPGSVPLTLRGDLVVTGAVIRSVGHRPRRVAAIEYGRLRSHHVVVGTTGTGKTTLLLRLWTGFMAAGLRRHAAGLGAAPLLVVLDCKGGPDARRVADRFRRVLREAGARSTAVWPDDASLSLWSLPPRQLTTALVDLIEHGTGAAAYYSDVMEALVGLAVEAPCGPPVAASDLLARLEPGWLSMAYAGSGTEADHALIRSASRHLSDVALRFRTLFRRLGAGLDGPGGFGDADAWYCILEGTAEVTVAEGQARALVDLLARFAVAGPERREILLAVDEFSAVSRRLPIWQLYERARSLGLALQVSAQSWQGLAEREDERYRIAASAEGGVWVLRTPHPEPLTGLAGTRTVTETTRRLARFPVWRHQGSSRLREVPVAEAGRIRGLDTGQVAHLHRGGVTFIQVKRLVAAPPAVAAAPIAPAPVAPAPVAAMRPAPVAPVHPATVPAGAGPARAASGVAAAELPAVGTLLDAAFGPEL